MDTPFNIQEALGGLVGGVLPGPYANGVLTNIPEHALRPWRPSEPSLTALGRTPSKGLLVGPAAGARHLPRALRLRLPPRRVQHQLPGPERLRTPVQLQGRLDVWRWAAGTVAGTRGWRTPVTARTTPGAAC
jgi:hypothetical protein